MAVYTTVDDEALETLLMQYDIGTLLSAKGIAEGVENTNYLLRTSAGTFILTLYENRVSPEDLPFFLGLMDHCAGSGMTVPSPVARRDGALLSEIAGRHAAIITFLDGMAVTRPLPAHCRAVGEALAHFHTTTSTFAPTRINSLGPASWAPLFNASRADADGVVPGLTALVDATLAEVAAGAAEHAEQAGWPVDLPRGIVHADLFPDNVFFIGRNVSGLIDFYFACTDVLAYDLAVALNAWCFENDGAFNITKGHALLSGYRAVRAMSQAEIDALPLLSQGAALRFLLTRLHDWLRVPEGALVTPKDPRPYVERLRFHRTVTSAADYGADLASHAA